MKNLLNAVRDTTVPARPRLKIAGFNLVWRPQWLVVCLVAGIGCFLLMVASIGIEEDLLNFGQVARVLTGGGTPEQRLLVVTHQLPRTGAAALAGAALGLSGALTMVRYGRPHMACDFTGSQAAAAAAAIATTALVTASLNYAAALSAAGLAASFIAALVAGGIIMAMMRHAARARRLGIVRVAIAGVVITLISQVAAYVAASALGSDLIAEVYVFGSFNHITPLEAAAFGLVVVIVCALVATISPKLYLFGIGDDFVTAIGTDPKKLGVITDVLALVLTAAVATIAGPLLFVSFLIPLAALKAVNTGTGVLVPSALLGAVAVLGADVTARIIPGPVTAGMLLTAIGAAIAAVILTHTTRRTFL